MIRRVQITGYRTYQRLDFEPHPEVNVLVGDNEAGKSTLLEAITLALTGRLNGRPALEELNPYSFNQRDVREFFEKRRAGEPIAPPEIHIEVELEDRDAFAKLIGANNSYAPAQDAPGVTFRVTPDSEYGDEFEEYVAASSTRAFLSSSTAPSGRPSKGRRLCNGPSSWQSRQSTRGQSDPEPGWTTTCARSSMTTSTRRSEHSSPSLSAALRTT